ncbi:PoNe immunity protein domain-containing protein [Succinimonas sp.]|jgi:hypothetical protein|uniref:PoNe immunity protein domain-containing protein n=1 Tax=Succinimonas sp. TaxID=1936151 RepID=UPI00386B2853|nr:DUF1911 domain-containing protein [Succinimonas sp.]
MRDLHSHLSRGFLGENSDVTKIRDPGLSRREYLEHLVRFNRQRISENNASIASAEKGESSSDVRPEIKIRALRADNYCLYKILLNSEYSLGLSCAEIFNDYCDAVNAFRATRFSDLEIYAQKSEKHQSSTVLYFGYFSLLRLTAMGLLLAKDNAVIEKLYDVAHRERVDDRLLNLFFRAAGFNASDSVGFWDKDPYGYFAPLLDNLYDAYRAMDALEEFVVDKWIPGHEAHEFSTYLMSRYYHGLWCYEAAALAKVLKIEDNGLKNNPHYPYDMAHYDNGMQYHIRTVRDGLSLRERARLMLKVGHR